MYIGIDPGTGGGVAAIDAAGTVIDARRMPATERDLLDWFILWREQPRKAMLERVWAVPGWGVSSSFRFGVQVGICRMALAASRMRWSHVMPVKWQTELGCRSKGDKNVTKRRAQELFPGVTITHQIADALLIAEYCRRAYEE